MTLRWIEGFDRAQNDTILGRAYDTMTGVIGVIGSGDGYKQGNSLSSASIVLTSFPLVGSVTDVWIIGGAFRVQAGAGITTSGAQPYVAFRDGTGEQIRLDWVNMDASPTKPGGSYYGFRLMRGATEIARTIDRFNNLASTDEWVFFEWKVTIDPSAGESEIRYCYKQNKNITATWNNSVTGINTANQGIAGADRFEISFNTDSGASDRVIFDDVYVCDDAGSVNNDFLGEIVVSPLSPDGNGSTLQWDLQGSASSIEDALNEGATTQSLAEDDKRLVSDTVGQISLATISDTPAFIAGATILGMQVRLHGRMDTSNTGEVEVRYRKTTGTPAETSGAAMELTSGQIQAVAETTEVDPNTGVAWVLADINGIQLGVRRAL